MNFSTQRKLSFAVTYILFRAYLIFGAIWYLSTERTLRKKISLINLVKIAKKYKHCKVQAKRLVASYLSDTNFSAEDIRKHTRCASKCMLMLHILPWGKWESRESLYEFAVRFGICTPIFDEIFDNGNEIEALAYSKNILFGIDQGIFTPNLLDDEILSDYFFYLESKIPDSNYELFQKTFRDLVFWQMRSLEQRANVDLDYTKKISEMKGAKSYLLLTLALKLPENAIEIIEACGSWAQHLDDYIDYCQDKQAGIVTYMNFFQDNVEAESFLLIGLDNLSNDIIHLFGKKSNLYICMLALSFLEKAIFQRYQNSLFYDFDFFSHEEAFPNYYEYIDKSND